MPDYLSLAATKLSIYSKEEYITHATGFIIRISGKLYLATNWHVVTGRRNDNWKPLSKRDIPPLPTRLTFMSLAFGPQLQPVEPQKQIIRLYDDEMEHDEPFEPLWLEHPEFKSNVDAILIPLPEENLRGFRQEAMYDNPDPRPSIVEGTTAFVLGYPQRITAKRNLPIWKQASIATDPEADYRDLPCFLIDTASRQGMSGAPVYFHSKGPFVGETGTLHVAGRRDLLLGIYSGRYPDTDELGAQLGIVWKNQCLFDIAKRGVQGKPSCLLVPK